MFIIKKVFFALLTFMFCMFYVNALTLNELKVGDIFVTGTEIYSSYISSPTLGYVAYYDKDNNLYESYSLYNKHYFSNYSNYYYIGESCLDSIFCDDTTLIVTNDDSYSSKVKYWEVVSVNNPDIYEFCGFGKYSSSYYSSVSATYPNSFCNQIYNFYEAEYGSIYVDGYYVPGEYISSGGYYTSGYYVSGYYTSGIITPARYSLNSLYGNFPFIVFKEVEVKEADYELVCETNGLKKDSIIKCILNVDSPHKIKDIVVSFDTEKYSVNKVIENDDWNLDVSDKDSEINKFYFVNDEGIGGKSKVMEIEFVLKEDVPSDFLIKTNNIDYSLTNNLNFVSTAEDTIDFVKADEEDDLVDEGTFEEEVENTPNNDKKEEIKEEKNPATEDSIRIVVLLLIFVGITPYTIRKKVMR